MLSSTLRHGVHVVTGFVCIGPWSARRGQAGWRVVPSAEVAKNLLDHMRVVNHPDDAHRVLAAQRVHMPNAEDQVAPSLGGEFERRWG